MSHQMSHQVTTEELENVTYLSHMAESKEDEKSLMLRSSPKRGISYVVVKKDTPVQLFTSLAAAVKKYNE